MLTEWVAPVATKSYPPFTQKIPMTLVLTLKYHWFDLTLSGSKTVEYRAMTSNWKRRIWERRHDLKEVCFYRGYTSQNVTKRITLIDIGPCPIEGWEGDFYRIHFAPL